MKNIKNFKKRYEQYQILKTDTNLSFSSIFSNKHSDK